MFGRVTRYRPRQSLKIYSFYVVQQKYFKSRSTYYSNGTATYNATKIQLELNGDVHPLLGPATACRCPECIKAVTQQNYRHICVDC